MPFTPVIRMTRTEDAFRWTVYAIPTAPSTKSVSILCAKVLATGYSVDLMARAP